MPLPPSAHPSPPQGLPSGAPATPPRPRPAAAPTTPLGTDGLTSPGPGDGPGSDAPDGTARPGRATRPRRPAVDPRIPGRGRTRPVRPRPARRARPRRVGTRRISSNRAQLIIRRPWRPRLPGAAAPDGAAGGQVRLNPNGSSRRWRGEQVAVGEQLRVGPSATIGPGVEDHARGHSSQGVGQVVGDHEDWSRRDAGSTSASSRRAAGSRLDDGSSSTRISGCMASTVATRDPAALPDGQVVGGAVAASSMPTAASAASTRRPAPGRACRGWPGRRRRRRATRRHEELVVGVLEDDPDPTADLLNARLPTGSLPTSPAVRRRSGCR